MRFTELEATSLFLGLSANQWPTLQGWQKFTASSQGSGERDEGSSWTPMKEQISPRVAAHCCSHTCKGRLSQGSPWDVS